jgi:adenylosuccinate synthase
MTRTARAVVDLGFGDAGKGTTVDYLAGPDGPAGRPVDLVVRHNGGGQAGHNVVTPDGRHHTFSQFGAATFHPGVPTLLSRHIALHPFGLLAEEGHLRHVGVDDALARLHVDARALVTTPYHQVANRLRELLRGTGRHGSCGVGFGETVADHLRDPERSIRAAHLRDGARTELRRRLARVRDAALRDFADRRDELAAIPAARRELAMLDDPDFLDETVEVFCEVGHSIDILAPAGVASLLERTRELVFEGAQGVMLDEWHGFHPHTTWSTTTFANVEQILDEFELEVELTRIGVLRTFSVRHGAGPFPTEDEALSSHLRDPHLGVDDWQGALRYGWPDAVLQRYAVEACGGIDALMLTHLDVLARLPRLQMARAYELPEEQGPPAADLARTAPGRPRRICALRTPSGEDLEHLSRLTALARRCAPVYDEVVDLDGAATGGWPSTYGELPVAVRGVVDAFAESLGAPVGWLSMGMTRREKIALEWDRAGGA